MKPKYMPWLATLGGFLLYCLAFRPIYNFLYQPTVALALLPVLAAAASFNVLGGLLAAALLVPLNLLLFLLAGENSVVAVTSPNFWATHLVLLIVGIVTGYFQSLRRKLKRELDEREAVQKQLSHLATHDALTDLPNRVLLFDRGELALARARRDHGKVACLFLDIDNFKQVNDTYGHEVGDKTLIMLAQRLKQSLRETDTVSRLGGDEFLILLEGDFLPNDINKICAKLLRTVAMPITVEEDEFGVTASIGVSIFPHDGEEINQLVKKADSAMYEVKGNQKNHYAFYSSPDGQQKIPGF